MAAYRMYALCVVLCIVHLVHGYSIRGNIKRQNGLRSEVYVSNYINGENWANKEDFTLDQLEGAETLPSLTIANFKSINTFYLNNVALENVPVFVNTRCIEMFITGNKIKSIRANAFSGPRPTVLNLSKNQIQSMAERSVNIGAKHVYLICNNLTHFSQLWFEDPGSIKILYLSGNRIEYMQDWAFSQMTQLNLLDISYNHITSIGRETFSRGIEHLFLHFNGITQLTADMFVHRDRPMYTFFLHHNQLSYLEEALLLKLRPQEIMLFGNPWQCQCLRDIERWLRELHSTRYDLIARRGEPVCVVPLSFQNVCVPAVDWESQQTYASGLSPVPECLTSPCKHCMNYESYRGKLT